VSRSVGERRRAREYALQLLFQLDLSPEGSTKATEVAVEEFWSGKKVVGTVRAFAEEIVLGTMGRLASFDVVLTSSAINWRVSRMPVVDRNILRMAIFEFLFHPETPRVVVIDEAIEIAKKFGNEESGPFINGILDSIRMKLEGGDLELPSELQSAMREQRTIA